MRYMMSSRVLSNAMFIAGIVLVLIAAGSIDDATTVELAQAVITALCGTALMIGGASAFNKG